MEEFSPISDVDVQHFKENVAKAAATGRGVVATFGGTAFGDIALVPAINMKHPRGVREIADWYMLTASRPDYVHAVFEHQCDVALANLARIHAAVGNAVSAVFVCGTDFGTQTSQFCSPETFRELYAPYYKRVNSWSTRTQPGSRSSTPADRSKCSSTTSSTPVSTYSTRSRSRPPGWIPCA